MRVIFMGTPDFSVGTLKALIDAVKSDQVKKFIEDKYEGAVVPIF